MKSCVAYPFFTITNNRIRDDIAVAKQLCTVEVLQIQVDIVASLPLQ